MLTWHILQRKTSIRSVSKKVQKQRLLENVFYSAQKETWKGLKLKTSDLLAYWVVFQ